MPGIFECLSLYYHIKPDIGIVRLLSLIRKREEGGSDINLISPSWMDATMITYITNVAYQYTHNSLLNQQTVQLRLANRSYCNRHKYKKERKSDDRDIVYIIFNEDE